MSKILKVGIAKSLIGVAALIVYRLLLRPRHVHWGATREEANRAMPGDDLVSDPNMETTRAVTIAAPPDQVWPWLAQMGYQRGGLYSYDTLDRLFGILDRPSADEILPEFQGIKAGDQIPLGSGPNWPVVICRPGQVLVVEPEAGRVSWAFVLNPQGDTTTRLVSRVRVQMGWPPLMAAISPAIDLPWLLMERKMLLGIRSRAEGQKMKLC